MQAYLDGGLLAGNHVAVTPNDSTDLAAPAAIYVGWAGDVACHDLDGAAVTYKNVPAGAILPVRVRRVLATGTTAADMVGLY